MRKNVGRYQHCWFSIVLPKRFLHRPVIAVDLLSDVLPTMDWFNSMKVSKYIQCHILCIIWFTHNFQFCLASFSRLKPSTTKINWQTVWVRNSNAIVLWQCGTCCTVFVSYKSSCFIYKPRRCLADLGNLSTFFICMFFIHELSTDVLIRFQSRLRQWP